MDTKKISEIVRVAYSGAKIVALVLAGVWTYYQRDRTIFPKENHEEMLRVALRRANLELSLEKFTAGSMDRVSSFEESIFGADEEMQPKGNASKLPSTQAVPLGRAGESGETVMGDFSFVTATPKLSALYGTLALKNPTPNPVMMQITGWQVSRLEKGSASITDLSTDWKLVAKDSPETVLGSYFSSEKIIENSSTSKIPFVYPYVGFVGDQKNPSSRSDTQLLRLEIIVLISALNPRTSEKIPIGSKEKRMRAFFWVDHNSSIIDNIKLGKFTKNEVISGNASMTLR